MMTAMMRVLALALSALSWPSLVCRALGGGPPRPLTQLAALAPAATVPAIAAVPVGAARSWRLALALAVPAAVLTCWQLPPRYPDDRERAAGYPGGARAMRVLTLNFEGGEAEAEQLARLLAGHHVDVLAGQEVTPEALARLEKAGLPDVLPHGVVDARPAYSGSAIWSDGPQLLAGDFNASKDHRPFRRLVAAGYVDCADAAWRRQWPAVTWPSGRWRRPVMRLDHVLASRADFTVQDSRTVLVAGTDHRGVLVSLRLREHV
jgi:endonuclease/exonuclease/phosphatase (EEP) superfamily protein YafD